MTHKFCEFCGKQLQEEFVFDHYDKDNGQPLYSKYLTCPTRKWWNFFVHDKRLVKGGSFGTASQYYTESYIKNLNTHESHKGNPIDNQTYTKCDKCGKFAVHLAMANSIIFTGNAEDNTDETSKFKGEDRETDVCIGAHIGRGKCVT